MNRKEEFQAPPSPPLPPPPPFRGISKRIYKEETSRATPPPPPPLHGMGHYTDKLISKKVDKETSLQAHPPPMRGTIHNHIQSSKNMDKEESPRPPPPPPPPLHGMGRYHDKRSSKKLELEASPQAYSPTMRGTGHNHNQSSKNMDKEESPRSSTSDTTSATTSSWMGRYNDKRSRKKLEQEASPQAYSPTMRGTGHNHNQSSKNMDKEESPRALPPPPPPPPSPPHGMGRYNDKRSSKKLELEASPQAYSPTMRGTGHNHNQSSKNMDKEESPRALPPPPPPPPSPPHGMGRYNDKRSSKKLEQEASPQAYSPTMRGTRHNHNQSSKNMDKEESPRAPPPPPPPLHRMGRYINKTISKRMDKEEVPLAPPFLGFRRYDYQSSKKMNKEEMPRACPHPTHPLIPSPLPPPFRGIRGYHNQNSKKMDKEVIHRAPPISLASQILEFMQFRKENPEDRSRCLLSHPSHPHNIIQKIGGNTKFFCFSCGERKSLIKDQSDHFSCKTCNVEFHRGCHKFPRKVTHPYHLQHPLTFSFRNHETGVITDGNLDESFASTIFSEYCTSEAKISDQEESGSFEFSRLQSNIIVDKCTWCGENIEGNWFYRCSICNFCLDFSCFQSIPPLFIANPKSHHHPLVFYPRPLLTPCDACGLVNVLEPSYACFQCNHMVHQSCINLPRVIKITRHQHRLFHTPYQSNISPCRVCYKIVDIKYGQYSCNIQDCSYVAHSRCSTHENIWDGKELEWDPEAPDEGEDIAPFKKVGNDVIKHFSHEHLLKLEKFDGIQDAEKQCQACVLPINSHDIYKCMQCEFFLHEVCAGLLRKLDHALHVHPLVLDPSPQVFHDKNSCLVCSRISSGFRYKCSKENCRGMIDVRCILVPDYFTHKAHEHPLFISTSYKSKSMICCEGCKEVCLMSYLQCSVCKFAMCYQCATIPDELCYKYDKHPLSLCYGEEADGMYWCEVCEKEVNPSAWFYTCNRCCVTIHLRCIFGSSVYMKHGFALSYHLIPLEIIHNSSSTRPLCIICHQRCPSSIYYKICSRGICSFNCLDRLK